MICLSYRLRMMVLLTLRWLLWDSLSFALICVCVCLSLLWPHCANVLAFYQGRLSKGLPSLHTIPDILTA